MTILFNIANPRAELARSMYEERAKSKASTRARDMHRHAARADAFGEALQVVDCYERGIEFADDRLDSKPVEMRDPDVIAEEASAEWPGSERQGS